MLQIASHKEIKKVVITVFSNLEMSLKLACIPLTTTGYGIVSWHIKNANNFSQFFLNNQNLPNFSDIRY